MSPLTLTQVSGLSGTCLEAAGAVEGEVSGGVTAALAGGGPQGVALPSQTGGGMFDLYEYPKDHIGRKRYVDVRGHDKSVPVIYTYKGCDSRNHILPAFGGDGSGFAALGPVIMPDIKGYKSPLDGSYVTSRSQHRDHMRQHEVIEVGTERIGTGRREYTPPPVRDDLRNALRKHGA